jgi:hypothetical protein
MTRPFRISHRWERRTEPLPFDPDDYVDDQPLNVAFERFSALNSGTIDLNVGDLALSFDLRSDLGMILEELPEALATLASGSDPVELYFAEQGSDVALVAAPAGDALSLRLRRGFRPGSRFAQTPDDLGEVSTSQFLGAWRNLVEHLLDDMTAMEPDLNESADVRAYRERLARLPGGESA